MLVAGGLRSTMISHAPGGSRLHGRACLCKLSLNNGLLVFDLDVLAAPPTPLACFRRGEQACIAWMGMPAPEAERLRELGVREGACLSIVESGANCILALGACRLALRREVAMLLFATPV